MTKKPTISLQGIEYANLFTPAGLSQLDEQFLSFLNEKDSCAHNALLLYRQGQMSVPSVETSELLITCAEYLEQFLAQLFDIEDEAAIAQAKTTSHNPIETFKKYFVMKRARREVKKIDTLPAFDDLNNWLNEALNNAAIKSDDKELSTALFGGELLENLDKYKEQIDQLVAWCAHNLSNNNPLDWVCFKIPPRLDYQKLVATEESATKLLAPKNSMRQRDGFKLTDLRMSAREVQNEINYCIYCHDHDGDFCSRGFPTKKGKPELGLKKNPLDLTMTGCPLDEKISEMHRLKKDGYTLGSLAMIMIDNPMCPATGHRICNDCMKACIYQKQEPVNIPQVETRILTDVLDLPWGVEIYDLLTRWNPLRQHQWVLKPYNGLKVMIAGMGPAGFTLAHHLTMEGMAVVGFDGLKIEPLPEELINQPIKHFDDLKESLDERLMAGFGGVAEYGITVRWDKNFLKLIYLTLMRRKHFQVFGGVRFGGTITIEDAWKMGFDHFAVAVGAGLPKALSIPNSLAPGMRQANDFLMALQLGNAAKLSSLTNLQIRMPAVIIGGGLTGVDTATEAQAYYITLVEKVLKRYELLKEDFSEEDIIEKLDLASRDTLDEYLRHGERVRQERKTAKDENRQPDFIKLIHEWGGVTIAYRRSMQESPAYINNHEEVRKALEEGIFYAEALNPHAVDLDSHGAATALVCHKRLKNEEGEWVDTTEEVRMPARSILVATGTQPNTAYEFEHRGTFNRVHLQYQHYEDVNGELTVAHGVDHCKDPDFGPFTSYNKNDKRVSLIGDTHPVFHGNVVKAIASGMRAYPKIVASLQQPRHCEEREARRGNPSGSLRYARDDNAIENSYKKFASEMEHLFHAHIASVTRKAKDIIEVIVNAPLAAKKWQPGQFYRLQNFESLSQEIHHTLIQMEPLALVAADCDPHHGTLTFYVEERTATAKLCASLKPGEPVSLMGPTGVRAKIAEEHETILMIGNRNSFPFVRSYAKPLTEKGNNVIFIATLNDESEAYCKDDIEALCEHAIWLDKSKDLFETIKNSHDILCDVDRIFLIGDTDLLRNFQKERKELVKNIFHKDPSVVASVHGNMQCMLKGVCAQCMQWQIDPETGKRTKAVFACSWQDQPLEIIDINHIDERNVQNRLLDQFNSLWVDYLISHHTLERI